jgi:hypothetical protein
MELKPHQVKAKNQMSNGKILWGGTGSGKSITILQYYLDNEAPKDIYIITTAQKRDKLEWEKEAANFAIGKKPDATVAGILTVDSWNNIGKYISIEDAFFIFDEQRLVGSGAWVKAFYKIARKNSWVMLSATPGDTWPDYIPVFVANGLFKNAAEFKREHVLYAPYHKFPKIIRFLNTDILEKYRNMLLVEMPYDKHTIRIVEDIPIEYDEEMFQLVNVQRWNPYEDRPLQDVAEMFRVMRKVVNTSPDRLDKIREILTKHPKAIVFYSFDYELDILRQLADQVTVAEWNGHKKQPIPKTDSWVYLVQYVAGAEGWNCIETDTVIFYSLTYSYRNFEQAQGRIDRLNTPFTNLHYFVLATDSLIDKAIRKNLRNKREFNEKAFAEHMFGTKLWGANPKI